VSPERDQRSTTESTEIHGKENPNQLSLSVSFPGATPARRVGSFRGYRFVMIFLAGIIPSPTRPRQAKRSETSNSVNRPQTRQEVGRSVEQPLAFLRSHETPLLRSRDTRFQIPGEAAAD